MKTDKAVKVLDEMTEACLRIDSTSGEAEAWKSVRSKVNSHDDMVSALEELAEAEAEYRKNYENHGGSDMRTGRAWDRMRRAGNAARDALKKAKE